MVWYWGGPEASPTPPRSVAEAAGDAKRPGRRQALCRGQADAGRSSSGARSTSLAAPSSTSTRASPASSAPDPWQARRLRPRAMAPHSLTMTMIGAARCCGSAGSASTCGSNLESNGRLDSGDGQHVRRDRRGRAGVDAGRSGSPRASRRCSASCRASSQASWRSRRPAASAGPIGAIMLGLAPACLLHLLHRHQERARLR